MGGICSSALSIIADQRASILFIHKGAVVFIPLFFLFPSHPSLHFTKLVCTICTKHFSHFS